MTDEQTAAASSPWSKVGTDVDGLHTTVEYLREVELPEIVEEVVRRVLLARPETPLMATYEVQSAAVDIYNERYDAANREEEDGSSTGITSPADKPDGVPNSNDSFTTFNGGRLSLFRAASTTSKKPAHRGPDLLCGLRKGNLEGCGASGKVFKAMDKGGTVYAVKQIDLPKTDTIVLEEAMAEYATLKQLTHRNIVRVWDFLANAGRAEIVMSYWTQGSVAAQIREFGALPPFTVRKYAVQLLRGLGYLHCCRVLHRDIKPQNVLVDATGCVALTDFGLCTVSEAKDKKEDGAPEAPKEMQVFGTWPYLSPGIVRHNRYTEQSDLWAFACSLLEMATAHMPWSGAGNGIPQTWTHFTYCFALLTASSKGITPIDVRHDWEGPPWPPEAREATLDLGEDLIGFLRLAFSGELALLRVWNGDETDEVPAPVTHRTLMTHAFLGEMRRIGSHKARKSAHTGPDAVVCKLEYDVPLSGKATVFLNEAQAELQAEEQESFASSLVLGDSAVAHASPFSNMDIRRKDEGAGFNNTDLGRTYCTRKRPAHVLLHLLGRTKDRRDVEPGMPSIILSPEVLHRTDDTTELVVDAHNIDRVCTEERTLGLSPDHIGVEKFGESTPDGPSAKLVYGPGRFVLTVGEVKHLTRSAWMHTTSDVPRKFLADLVALTSRPDQQLFWSAHRAIPLSKVGEPEEEELLREVVRGDIERATASCEQIHADRELVSAEILDAGGTHKTQLQRRLLQLDTELMRQRHWLARGRDYATVLLTEMQESNPPSSSVTPTLATTVDLRPASPRKSIVRVQGQTTKPPFWEGFLEFQAWRQHVTLFPFEYGFPSAADGKAALEQSLTELCTAVCVSQLGYFMVDGCDGNHSQLVERTPQPVVFLSAAGLDFNKPLATLREASKYFSRPTNLPPDTPGHQGWQGMLPLAQFRLKERLKELYRCIFECAQHHGARNLSMLPMGLGWFLANVHPEDKPVVRKAYFGAQFELLCEWDFGFETYYLSAGSPEQRALAEQTLEEWLSGTETGTPAALRCNVVFHSCDAKFLAVELAKRSMAPAILNPADCAATVLGQLGTFWEDGRGSHYSGEEDVCAHSTAVLGRVGIADVWGHRSTKT
eukprot:TRINITY_DN2246_c1_g1_i1.p1 TRINITY_DN2246_c1_g1~~TRINITY_DN2246_c1_g1_i1.p1  ORF type:complete len:1111 (+),score=329.44 TRINITY_DN2246_c1_g1_i1:117-3449(+)